MNVKSIIILMINIMMVFITLYALLWLQNIDMVFAYTIITGMVGIFSIIILDLCD